jgi:antitoxin CptB
MFPMSDTPDEPPQQEAEPQTLDPRRKRLLFRAWHRGTKETDLMVGHFVARNIASFAEAELDDLEAVLEHLDVDMQDWLSGRRPIPEEVRTPMLERMARECTASGAGMTAEMRGGLGRTGGGEGSAS